MSTKARAIDIRKIVGKGYGRFWNFKGRYKACKGARASKKSKTSALEIVYKMMYYWDKFGVVPNTLVVRRIFNTLKDSCYTELIWAINTLGVADKWKVSKSPLEMTYLPSGGKILFRGLDNPMSITSITVEKGNLCWAWWEEAFQVMNEDDFNKVDLSIRGKLPEPLYYQHIITFNPWSDRHWLKKRFYDETDEVLNKNILAMTTTYKQNEFLGESDLELFANMERTNPRRYEIEGKGKWGIAEGLVYENWRELEFDWREILKREYALAVFGLDFGYTNDPTAFICSVVDEEAKEIYIFDEYYKTKLSNRDIADVIKQKGFAKEIIIADSAEPKSIAELKLLGIQRTLASTKGKDSINHGIQFIQGYKIYVHPRCSNIITELSNYVWAVKDGQVLNVPIDDFNHGLDGFRYSLTAKFNQAKLLSLRNKIASIEKMKREKENRRKKWNNN